MQQLIVQRLVRKIWNKFHFWPRSTLTLSTLKQYVLFSKLFILKSNKNSINNCCLMVVWPWKLLKNAQLFWTLGRKSICNLCMNKLWNSCTFQLSISVFLVIMMSYRNSSRMNNPKTWIKCFKSSTKPVRTL